MSGQANRCRGTWRRRQGPPLSSRGSSSTPLSPPTPPVESSPPSPSSPPPPESSRSPSLFPSIAPKIKDPDARTISYIIGDHAIEKALIDLGEGVNLLPYLVYIQLGLGELKPTTVVLQLADRSVKKPRGVIEDVIIRVDKFYFPIDFIILDAELVTDPTKLIPVILGRPFLATVNACINCRTREMEVTFGNMKVKLNIFNAFQHPLDTNECFFLDMIEETVEDTLPHLFITSPLEACLSHFNIVRLRHRALC